MKILMVCLGNICRSPLAEGIMREKAKKYHLDLKVDSAGTAAYHTGEKPDIRSIEIARQNGIDITTQRARKFKIDDFNNFDRIYAMDESNLFDLISVARSKDDIDKIQLILKITFPDQTKSVPDPYYGGNDGFKDVYDMLDDACEIIAAELAKNK
jgi:protein-tyrosine phosphatase